MGATADQTIMITIGVLLAIAGGITLLVVAAAHFVKEASAKQGISKFLVAGIAALACGVLLISHFSGEQQESALDRNLNEQADEINSKLPKMLDENTRYDAVSVQGKLITYRHTVVNHTAEELDMNAFQSIMHEKLTKEQCPKEEIVEMLKGGIEYQYLYYGKAGGLVSAVKISPITCGIK